MRLEAAAGLEQAASSQIGVRELFRMAHVTRLEPLLRLEFARRYRLGLSFGARYRPLSVVELLLAEP